MDLFLVSSSAHVIQQMGFGAAVGGIFIVVYLMTALAVILAVALLSWGLWRFVRAKQGKPRKPLSALVQVIVVLLSLYPIWMGVMYLEIWYGQYRSDQAYKAETIRRFTELDQTTRFGEMLIPAGSLINRGDPDHFRHLAHRDPLLNLETVRFNAPTSVAGVLAYAMSIEGSSLTLELAQEYQLSSSELSRRCLVGDILLFPYPERRISEEQRITPPYTWFSPSDWEPRTCFDSTSGIMVKHVNQHGIYFPKNRAPYTPQ